LGQNGAGKTTTFSVISGIVRSSSGQVLICGKDLKENLGECRKQMGLLSFPNSNILTINNLIFRLLSPKQSIL
jgi:ABC-type multidrug transport system ATPase subunit